MIQVRVKFENSQEVIDFTKFFTNDLLRKNSQFNFAIIPSKVYRLRNGQFKVFYELCYYFETQQVKEFEKNLQLLRKQKGQPKKRGRKPKYAKQ